MVYSAQTDFHLAGWANPHEVPLDDDSRVEVGNQISFELFENEDGKGYDITLAFDWDPVYREAYVGEWYVTEAGRMERIDWHLIGVPLSEIYYETEFWFRQEMEGELVW